MLGYAFMGKAHTNAYKKIPYMMYPPPAIPKLVGDRGPQRRRPSKRPRTAIGYEGYYTDWRKMLEDDRIQLFDNGGPNDTHAEPCIAAAAAGKHILCEKPLARTAEEAKRMLDAVDKGRRQAHGRLQLSLRAGHPPGVDLIQTRQAGADLPLPRGLPAGMDHAPLRHADDLATGQEACGSGALGDLGAHIIDLGRFLVGEMKSVSA